MCRITVCCTCNDEEPLVIGDNVVVGHNANLHSCEIGEGSLIGIGAVVLDGVKIGKNCLVAAGALVTPNKGIPGRKHDHGVACQGDADAGAEGYRLSAQPRRALCKRSKKNIWRRKKNSKTGEKAAAFWQPLFARQTCTEAYFRYTK